MLVIETLQFEVARLPLGGHLWRDDLGNFLQAQAAPENYLAVLYRVVVCQVFVRVALTNLAHKHRALLLTKSRQTQILFKSSELLCHRLQIVRAAKLLVIVVIVLVEPVQQSMSFVGSYGSLAVIAVYWVNVLAVAIVVVVIQ